MILRMTDNSKIVDKRVGTIAVILTAKTKKFKSAFIKNIVIFAPRPGEQGARAAESNTLHSKPKTSKTAFPQRKKISPVGLRPSMGRTSPALRDGAPVP